jgi:hypothetical protein
VKTNDFSVIQTEVTFTNFIVENHDNIGGRQSRELVQKNVPGFRMCEEVWLSEDKKQRQFCKE